MKAWRVTYSRTDERHTYDTRDIEHDDPAAVIRIVGDIVNGKNDGYVWEFERLERIWRPILNPVDVEGVPAC